MNKRKLTATQKFLVSIQLLSILGPSVGVVSTEDKNILYSRVHYTDKDLSVADNFVKQLTSRTVKKDK